MIVGASVLQLPGIIRAKELGLRVAVVDYNPKAIGIKYADDYYEASTMDEDAVLQAALDFNPDAIMTLATDMPMRGVAKVCDKLHLHGIHYETAIKATDKYEMIKAFKEYNVPSPWFFVANSLKDIIALEGKLSFPCIIKPTDNAGSHGVAKVDSFQELLKVYNYSHSFSRGGNVIIEEYLDGPEVSVEIIYYEGTANILQITDKLTTGAPFFVEMGHSQPSSLDSLTIKLVRETAINACDAIGIENGPAHVEMKITNRGPVMVELGARMGGDNISTHLVPLSTGIDMVEATIQLALGNPPEVSPHFNKGSAIRYFTAPEGTISSIQNIKEACRIPGVKQITMTKEIGDRSSSIRCSNDRIGFVIAQAESVEKAVDICEKALKTVEINVV